MFTMHDHTAVGTVLKCAALSYTFSFFFLASNYQAVK
jgi:hypothetical protein